MKNNICVFIDPGHGGLNPYTGKYATAPDKQHQHAEEEFHCDGWFYEGVSNRDIAFRIQQKLAALGVPSFNVAHLYEDTPLPRRVHRANTLRMNYDHTVYVSIHSNAFNGNVRGYELFTSPGQDNADALANCIYAETVAEFGTEIDYRPDLSGGPEKDKERRFYVLERTRMPSVLVEYLFFDNLEDARLLADAAVQDRFASATVLGIMRYFAEQFSETGSIYKT